MRLICIALLILTLALAACTSSASEDSQLPTLAAFASSSADLSLSPEPDTNPTLAPSVSTQMSQSTPTTEQAVPSATLKVANTAAATRAAVTSAATSVASISAATEVLEDLRIMEADYQKALDQAVSAMPAIVAAQADFMAVDSSIHIQVTVKMNGLERAVEVLITPQMFGGTVQFTGGFNLPEGAPAPTAELIDLINGEFYLQAILALDHILTEKFGPEPDIEGLDVKDTHLEISIRPHRN
ncbi:hypothetical protein MASR2M15_00940 [Anaerolineales bacterium]